MLGEVGGGFPVIERVVEAGIAATAAEAVGAMETMQAMTLEYLKTRMQFGRHDRREPGVAAPRQPRCSMALEQGRSMAMLAAMMVDEPDADERAHNIAMAKVGVGQAARFVSQNAVQLHGGIGMTEEYAVGHYFRRVHGHRAHLRRHRPPPVAAGRRRGVRVPRCGIDRHQTIGFARLSRGPVRRGTAGDRRCHRIDTQIR